MELFEQIEQPDIDGPDCLRAVVAKQVVDILERRRKVLPVCPVGGSKPLTGMQRKQF
jgi:hypothetical protein